MRVSTATLVVAAVAILAGGCASRSVRADDAICTELARFADAGSGEFPRGVVLRGGWGGDRPGTLMTHECKAEGGGGAEGFCAYLAHNTSWEFGHYTVERVAACFEDSGPRRAILALSEKSEHAEVSVANPWSVSGASSLTIRFTPASGGEAIYRFEIVANAPRPL